MKIKKNCIPGTHYWVISPGGGGKNSGAFLAMHYSAVLRINATLLPTIGRWALLILAATCLYKVRLKDHFKILCNCTDFQN